MNLKKISCIAIDDEPLAVQLMEAYISRTPFLEMKGSFTSGNEAYRFLQDNEVELIFCDIQMPEIGGMDLSKSLPEDTRIIFTTAFSQYALEGYKVHALDYLLKPVSYDDFLAAAKHAQKVISEIFAARAEESAQPEGKSAKSIFIKTEYRLQQISLDNISFIEGLKDYVKIHLCNGEDPVLSLMRMKTLEEMLPSDRFLRVHRSFIVRTESIEAIERNHIIIGKERIPIGDTYKDSLFDFLSESSLVPDKQ